MSALVRFVEAHGAKVAHVAGGYVWITSRCTERYNGAVIVYEVTERWPATGAGVRAALGY